MINPFNTGSVFVSVFDADSNNLSDAWGGCPSAIYKLPAVRDSTVIWVTLLSSIISL